jgi:hypothetical protein
MICTVKYEASTRFMSTTYANGAFDGKTLWYYTNRQDPRAGGYIVRPNGHTTLEYTFFWLSSARKEDRVTKGTFEQR